MSYILVYLFLISGSLLLTFYNKKFEETLPITSGVIILILYLSYIFNILKVGLILLGILIICLYGLFIYKAVKLKKVYIKNIFTVGFFSYTILFIVLIFYTKNFNVIHWDDFRMWASYPKALYYTDKIQLAKDTLLHPIALSYFPGSSLFYYFVCKINGVFMENTLNFAYSLLGLNLLTYICKNIKKYYYIPLIVLIIFIFPLSINNGVADYLTYYRTLFIEPLEALYIGYIFYLIINKKDNIDYINIIISMIVLCLLKNVMILPCIILGILYLIVNKENFIKRVLPLIMPIITFLSYELVLKIYHVSNPYISNNIFDSNIFTGILTSLYTRSMFKSNIFRLNNILVLPVCIIIILTFIILFFKKSNNKKYLHLTWTYLLFSLIYLLGVSYTNVYIHHATTSFIRYLSTIVTSGLFIILLLVFENINNKKYLSINLIFIIFILLIGKFTIKDNYDPALYEIHDEVSTIIPKINDDTKLAFSKNAYYKQSNLIYELNAYMGMLDKKMPFKESLIIDKSTVLPDDKEIIFIVTLPEDYKLLESYDVQQLTTFGYRILNKTS